MMMMKSSTSFRFSSLMFFFIIVASMAVYSEARICSQRLIVQTGIFAEAGTDSRISVTLGNAAGERLEIPDLTKWGTMATGHNYFENGNRDHFHVNVADCLLAADALAPVCNITVTSDGSGQKHGWFLKDVEVRKDFGKLPIAEGLSPYLGNTVNFNFDQWLAKDEPPYKLTASVNKCK